MTPGEIEKACGVSCAAIYQAVNKTADCDGTETTLRERERKLTPDDVQTIKRRLSEGVLRKHILAEYDITKETLIKYVGTIDDYRSVPEELKQEAVRLRAQGKTLQQTADILGVTVSTVKDAWREMKDSPDINEKRVKYDNWNPLSKRGRDQAVNAALRDGITRKQLYTVRNKCTEPAAFYPRSAEKELEALRESILIQKARRNDTPVHLMRHRCASGSESLFKVLLQFSGNALIDCLHPLRVKNNFIFDDLFGIDCFFLNAKDGVSDKPTDEYVFSNKF